MAKDLIAALSPARDDQFARRGVKKAFEAFNRAIKDGFVYGVELDLANFYPSVKLGHLIEARKGLPVQVIRNVIWMDERTPISPSMSSTKKREPIGLALGGVSSPIAAEKIIEGILGSLPKTVCVINYADNVFILGVTRIDVERAKATLEDRARQLPAGSLIFVPVGEISDLRQTGACFLGAEGHFDPAERRLVWEPGHGARSKIEREIEAVDGDVRSIDRALHQISGWYHTCDQWSHRNHWASLTIGQLLGKAALHLPGYSDMTFIGHIAQCYLALAGSVTPEELLPVSGGQLPERKVIRIRGRLALSLTRLQTRANDERFLPPTSVRLRHI